MAKTAPRDQKVSTMLSTINQRSVPKNVKDIFKKKRICTINCNRKDGK